MPIGFGSTTGTVSFGRGRRPGAAAGGPVMVRLLLIAGGGGGGWTGSGEGGGAGGGAGGLLYYGTETPKTPNGGELTFSSGVTYTISIGAGGTGAPSNTILGTNGGNTTITASDSSIEYIAIGGGRGGGYPSAWNGGGTPLSLFGGSGGGMYTGMTSSVAGQGNDGGWSNGSPCYAGGGGGGAGGKGLRTVDGEYGSGFACTGGPGLTYSITGSPGVYAGGGGGYGRCGAYSGGDGGGGAGNGGDGVANTGGGGGGTSATYAGAGGSGKCVISADTAAVSYTGATYNPTGGRHVYTFNSTGSITF